MKTDVCFILEGTYPYVYGGVSNWIHNLVTSLGDLKFSIIHVSATGDTIRTHKYEIPDNIVEFKEIFVHDYKIEKGRTRGSKREGWRAIREFYDALGSNDLSKFTDVYKQVIDKNTRSLNAYDLMNSDQAWKMMTRLYQDYAPDVSFVDFYWTIKFIHSPLLNLVDVEIPEANVFHTVCTGYAGLLSVIAKMKRQKPLLLTEHGIYTHERKIEISKAKWIHSEEDKIMRATRTLGFFKEAWIKKFETLSKLTYDYADKIVTLFEGNRKMQIEGGADPSKISIIPNGVDVLEEQLTLHREKETTKNIGFIGRVVSIKDVKIFIRAMKILKERMKDIKVFILGSGDEEPEYFNECKTLTQMLQLEDNITFTGNVNVEDYYPMLDAVVLTSISEGQPLTILEAMSYGIPIVASDVGACRELIYGKDEDDRNLGEAGILTNIGSPHETAGAIMSILQNKDLYQKMSETGVTRIKKYYRKENTINSYRELYESLLR